MLGQPFGSDDARRPASSALMARERAVGSRGPPVGDASRRQRHRSRRASIARRPEGLGETRHAPSGCRRHRPRRPPSEVSVCEGGIGTVDSSGRHPRRTGEVTMEYRKLGNSGLSVSAIGLGCMSMSGIYGKSDDEQSIAVIHRALDLGITLVDSSDMYGWGHNEELVGRALKGRRERAVLVTKFGQVQSPDGKGNLVDGSPAYVARACEASLRRLGVDVIDVYFQHRVDPKVPIEDTVGAMTRLIEQGKVRYLGLSEAAPATIRPAHAVHP